MFSTYFPITQYVLFWNYKYTLFFQSIFFNWLVHPNDGNFIIYVPWYQYFWYTGKCQNKIKERCIDFLKIPSNVKIKQMISRQQRKWINTRLQISSQWSFLAPHLFLLSQMFSNLYIMVGRKNIAMFDIYFFMVLKITHCEKSW